MNLLDTCDFSNRRDNVFIASERTTIIQRQLNPCHRAVSLYYKRNNVKVCNNIDIELSSV